MNNMVRAAMYDLPRRLSPVSRLQEDISNILFLNLKIFTLNWYIVKKNWYNTFDFVPIFICDRTKTVWLTFTSEYHQVVYPECIVSLLLTPLNFCLSGTLKYYLQFQRNNCPRPRCPLSLFCSEIFHLFMFYSLEFPSEKMLAGERNCKEWLFLKTTSLRVEAIIILS